MNDKHEDVKAEKRDRILAVAADIIVQRGFEATTMDEIAEKAELSKGALYLHYASKDELYLAIHAQHDEQLVRQISALFTESVSGIDLIRNISSAYIHFLLNTPGFLFSLNYFENYRDIKKLQKMAHWPHIEKNVNSLFALAVRAFQIGMADGSVHQGFDAKRMALYYWSGIRGLIDLHVMKNRNECLTVFNTFTESIEELIHGYHELMMASISKPQKLTNSQ